MRYFSLVLLSLFGLLSVPAIAAGRNQTLGEIPPTPLLKGGSESLKVPAYQRDLGGSTRIGHRSQNGRDAIADPLLQSPEAETLAQLPSQSVQTRDDFWLPAQKLTQDQIYLLHRIEQALEDPNPNRIRAVRGQLLLHVLTLERFLEKRYPLPDAICRAGAPPTLPQMGAPEVNPFGTPLTEAQSEAYCYLYASLQRISPMLPVLNERLQMLAGIAEVRRVPLPTGEWVPHRVLPGIATFEKPNLRAPASPLFAPAPDLPVEEPPVIGRETKSLLAGYRPPSQPAIAPPERASKSLKIAKDLLKKAQDAFPTWAEFVNPDELIEHRDTENYALRPRDVQGYGTFLANANTGAARLMPASAYRVSANTLRNRLAPTVAERYPFAALPSGSSRPSRLPDSLENRLAPPAIQRYPFAPFPEREDEFAPRLAIQLEDGQFQVAQLGLDYGFMVDLGDVPLEKLDETLGLPKRPRLKPEPLASRSLRQFFLDYRPPQELEALQVDRRRFFTGKVNALSLTEPLYSEAPAEVNRTYLVRLIQFNLPDAIADDRPLLKTDRRYVPLILDMQSSDTLVAFRPVRRRADGSYTVLWKVLAEFPDPQIEDLQDYVRYR